MGEILELIKNLSTFDLELILKYDENDYESYDKFLRSMNAYDIYKVNKEQFIMIHKINKM